MLFLRSYFHDFLFVLSMVLLALNPMVCYYVGASNVLMACIIGYFTMIVVICLLILLKEEGFL